MNLTVQMKKKQLTNLKILCKERNKKVKKEAA